MPISLDDFHPDYDQYKTEWALMRDTISGERRVKDKREEYLPKPDGMRAMESSENEGEPELGRSMYEAYLKRARFPDVVKPAIAAMVGTMHRVAATITMPDVLDPLRESATPEGLPLEALHKRITRELLSAGRYGVAADVKEGGEAGGVTPYLVGYLAENIRNWSGEGTFYVLDESYYDRDGFAWKTVERYRVVEQDEETKAVYVRIFEKRDGNIVEIVVESEDPIAAPDEYEITDGRLLTRTGGAALERMPVVIGNATDIVDSPDDPPLIGMARAAIAAYQLYADYRHQLFWSGQETLVITGLSSNDDLALPKAVGAGVMLVLPEDTDAKYIGTEGKGIAAHKTAIDDELSRAAKVAAMTYETRGEGVESGEARRMRLRESTVKLIDVALTSAGILERALKVLAEWTNANPDDVSVVPSLQFLDTKLSPDEIEALLKAWMAGAISKQTLYDRLLEGEIATHDRSFEEEEDLISQEAPDLDDGTADEMTSLSGVTFGESADKSKSTAKDDEDEDEPVNEDA